MQGIYGFCRDQGSIIAGILALFAGLLAYYVGRQQINFLQKSEARRHARMVISSARLLDGILKIVADNIEEIDSFDNSSARTIEQGGVNQIRQSLQKPPCYELIEQLSWLGREIIDNYFLLCSKIEKFRKQTTGMEVSALSGEVKSIRNIVNNIRKEIGDEGSRAQKIFD